MLRVLSRLGTLETNPMLGDVGTNLVEVSPCLVEHYSKTPPYLSGVCLHFIAPPARG